MPFARPPMLAAALLAAVIAGGIWAVSRPAAGEIVRAEFADARGLVGGNDVRINGAPAGTVASLTLTARGTAMVTMRLDPGLAAVLRPRADATAAIRPVDLLGDNYVALDPGHAQAPLRRPIPVSRTLDAPRLSDALSIFRDPVRTGLQALLVEVGTSLDERGADVNQAALALRPTLEAADAVMREVGSQNADLRSLVADAQQVTAQAAARDGDLAGSVADLDRFVQTTASHLSGLGRGIATLPRTLEELTTTAADLRGVATGARPLAVTLGQLAPGLGGATARLPSFLAATASAAHRLDPTLHSAATVLASSDPTLHALASGLGALPPIGGPLATFAAAVARAAPSIAEGFFVNFPDQASEPGGQPLDPFGNGLRDYWRGAGVMTCEAFGVPIAPGCLTRWLASHGGSPGGRRSEPAARPLAPHAPPAAAGSTGSPTTLRRSARPVPPSPAGIVSSVASPPQSAPLRGLLSYLIGR